MTVTGECIKQAGQAGLFAKLQVAFEPYRGEESIVVESRLQAGGVAAALGRGGRAGRPQCAAIRANWVSRS